MSFVVHIIQVKLPLKLRLKLIVMISLSIHMMTSQGRMCAQCVTDGLHRKLIWIDINWYTVHKSGIHVMNVGNVSCHRAIWMNTRIFTQVDTSAQNVADVVKVVVT